MHPWAMSKSSEARSNSQGLRLSISETIHRTSEGHSGDLNTHSYFK